MCPVGHYFVTVTRLQYIILAFVSELHLKMLAQE